MNQPEPFPGYGGFVGWESPVLLRHGTWLVGAGDLWYADVRADSVYSTRWNACLSVWVLPTGGHQTEDPRTNPIWVIRFRIKKDYSGIELLPRQLPVEFVAVVGAILDQANGPRSEKTFFEGIVSS
jgi:hypothetical protein